MKTNSNTITEPVLIVDSHHGIYVPKIFLQNICAEIKKQIPSEDRMILRDVDHEDHDEAWDDVLQREYKLRRQKITFDQIEGDVWAIPACFLRSKEYKNFNPERF